MNPSGPGKKSPHLSPLERLLPLLPPRRVLVAGLVLMMQLVFPAAHAADDLARQFAHPPASARPWVWGHWLHGNVSKESITRELEAMQRVGLGGMTMFDVAQPGIPPGPHKYFDASWQELFAWQIAEARRLGLEVMTQNGPGYSGNGGPWISHELAAQKIVESATRVAGGRKYSGVLPPPACLGGFYRDVAVLALRETAAQAAYKIDGLDPKRLVWLNYVKWMGTRSAPPEASAPAEVCIPREQVVDLTRLLQLDGTLTWDVPPGDWTLLRFGHTWTGQKTLPATPEGLGPECDKLNPRGIRTHFAHVMRRMIELAGPAAGKTFHTFFVDSWEAGGQNWTEHMPAEFRRRRGYDLIPFLPVLTGRVLGDLQTSERFLYDLRLTVSELVTENFWAEMQRLCRTHGMRLAVQPYITTGQDLDAANYTDEPMGEFWALPNTTTDYRQTVKLAASAADLNGRAIVGVEAFTSTAQEKWQSHPATLKALADQIFCLGANRFQFHRFAMQRFPQLRPGMMMGGWGQQYDSTQTWWEWSGPWHDYLARCQYLLRQGPVVADVLVVFPEEPLHRFEHQPIPGFDYDGCGPDTFRRATVRDGVVTLPHDRQYRLLVVQPTDAMSLGRLRQLRDLVIAGASLLGEPPRATPGLTDLSHADEHLRALAAELWGQTGESDRPVGRGRVFRGLPPAEALRRLGATPDFTGPAGLSWIHRAQGDTDIFFLASAAAEPVLAACIFRLAGRRAELWDPLTGRIQPLATSPTGDHRTAAHLPLEANGSFFVVFRPGPPTASPREQVHAAPSTPPAKSLPVPGPWTLSFPPDSGAPAALPLPALISWSRHADAAVRHFSGTATYRTTFDAPPAAARVVLDLGRVEVMARVRLNGRDLGILWRPPFRIDVTDALRPGHNDLEIAVVNLWVNRLIGDAARPDDAERDKSGRLASWPRWVLAGQTSPTGRRSFVTFPLWKKGEPLKDSGLLGPVTLQFPAAESPRP